ncbi:MAG TPA: two-component regulator propeller domain-containing protein [Vicinamibacterales bacterium]|nr:two-component regulator propeller domain-containing protein [Vicinamibacterales bacterium]
MVRLVHVKGLDRVVTRLFTFMAAVVGLVIVGCRSAEALDPARTLTQYVHRIWQVQQGLPQASVYAIVQTGDGRLWLGTQTGLVRFDGVRFTSIDEMNGISLADVWVTRLIEDHDRALWIGTDQSGVFKLSNGVLTHYSTQDGLPADAVQCLFEGRDGRVWVCTTRGLATWNGKEFRAFEPPAGRTIRNVRATCETPDGHLWIAHDDHDLDVAAGQSNEAGAGGARPERLGVGPQAVSMQAQALPAGAQVTIHAMLCSA